MVLVTDLINSLCDYILQSCHRGFSFFPSNIVESIAAGLVVN